MAINYSTSILFINTVDEGDRTDVAKEVVYEITATEGDKSFSSMKTVPLGDAGDDFTPYGSLTESQVKTWAEAVIGDAEIAALRTGLNSLFTNPIHSAQPTAKQTPW